MFCTNCGKEIREDSKFCMHCGNSIIKTAQFGTSVHREENEEANIVLRNVLKSRCFGIVIAIFLILILVFIVKSNRDEKQDALISTTEQIGGKSTKDAEVSTEAYVTLPDNGIVEESDTDYESVDEEIPLYRVGMETIQADFAEFADSEDVELPAFQDSLKNVLYSDIVKAYSEDKREDYSQNITFEYDLFSRCISVAIVYFWENG